MRIYVPATLDELDAVTVTGDAARWDLTSRAAHAVTPELVAALPDEDEEGQEYAAALEAASDSLALVAARPGVPLQRVVVTVEVPDDAVGPAGPDVDGFDVAPSAVRVLQDVPGVAIVCVHVDEPEAAADIADVLAAADQENEAEETEVPAGTEEAEPSLLDEALQRVTDRDLLWYDWTEVKDLPRA